MKHLYFLILLCFSFNLNAQKYHPDRISIQNKEYDYRFHHLEQYFNYYPEKRIVTNKDSTIINRGYIAFYEIYNDEIYLKDIKIPEHKNNYSKLISVRDKFTTSKEARVPLRWVNGVIQIGIGSNEIKNDSLKPVNTNNLIFEINKGKIQRSLQFNKEEMRIFNNFQWNKFYNTREYAVLTYKLKNIGLTEGEIVYHVYNNILYYSKKIYLQK